MVKAAMQVAQKMIVALSLNEKYLHAQDMIMD